MTSSDVEEIRETAIEVEKMDVEKVGQQNGEEKTRLVKRGKGTNHMYNENTTKKTREAEESIHREINGL